MLVEDTAAARQFYMEVLGMTDDYDLRNPNLPFDGTFLRAGNSQIHLMELPSVDPKTGRPAHGGR
jgi:glyoxylase I family protein